MEVLYIWSGTPGRGPNVLGTESTPSFLAWIVDVKNMSFPGPAPWFLCSLHEFCPVSLCLSLYPSGVKNKTMSCGMIGHKPSANSATCIRVSGLQLLIIFARSTGICQAM